MFKRFFSFTIGCVVLIGNLYGDNFDEYKQAFANNNYNKIFTLYRENTNKESQENYKEYLFNEIIKAISTNRYHAQKLIHQFLSIEPNNNYGRYFLATLLYEDGDYHRSYTLVSQLKEGYLEADLSDKIDTLFDKLNTILYPPEKIKQTISLEKQNNQYFIEVKIDNEKGRLLIDTGATTTMLNSSIAQKLYCRTINDSINIQTASGMTKAKKIEVQNLLIDDLKFERIEIIVSKEDVFRGFDGLLGMNILKHFQLDTKHNKLIFEH